MKFILWVTPLLAVDGTCALRQWSQTRADGASHLITGLAFSAGLVFQWSTGEDANVHFYGGLTVAMLGIIHAATGVQLLLKM